MVKKILCGCEICQDRPTKNKVVGQCTQCYDDMTNVQIKVYWDDGISQHVTSEGYIWTSNHGWSSCDRCNHIGPYKTQNDLAD